VKKQVFGTLFQGFISFKFLLFYFPIMQEKNLKIILGVVFFFIVLFIVLIAFNSVSFGYSYYTQDNVLIASNHLEPKPYLEDLSNRKTFVVSPEMYESSTVNSFMGNSMNLFLVVLTGNDKNAILMARVLDEQGNFSYCKTNWGDFKTEETISKQACLDFLNSTNAVKILIEAPHSSELRPFVQVSVKEIKIRPKRISDLGLLSFSLLKEMFPNAREIVDKTNLIVHATQ